MDLRDSFRTAGTGLKHWFIAQTYDALAVGLAWLIGLLILRVPAAVFWALLAACLQYVPGFGTALALVGPALAAAFSGGTNRLLYVLGLYAAIVVFDGLFLQPWLMKRTVRIPIWASLLMPLVLGLFFSFWGVLIAAPLLAVIYAFRQRQPQSR
jgi:predicted PurR-regulated permease PerM